MIIYALGIHSGGGKVLLDHLISSSMLGKIQILICDSRYQVPSDAASDMKIIKIPPTLIRRWKAEYTLKFFSRQNPKEDILCFSNLPPAFKLSGKTILFFQNALLLPKIDSHFDSFTTKLRVTYEKLWIFLFLKNVNQIWIQSNWMRPYFFKTQIPIMTKPFLPTFPAHNFKITKKYDFICVTGNASHKKLNELLKEWDKMPTSGPSLLIITEQPSKHIQSTIDNLKNINIHFVTNASREDIFEYYQQSNILLVTTQIESFCLPIYEASHFNLKILALRSEFSLEIPCINEYLNTLSCAEILDKFKKINSSSH